MSAEQAIGYRMLRRVEVSLANLRVSLSVHLRRAAGCITPKGESKLDRVRCSLRHSPQHGGNHSQPQESWLLHQARKNYDVDTGNLPTNPTPMPEFALCI